MSKICSLDFLKKKEFDLDIISIGEKKLFSVGDKITPEILLSLYFKEILAREPEKPPEEIERLERKAKMEQIDQTFAFLDMRKALEPFIENQLSTNIPFDTAHAKRIMQLSYNLGVAIDMSDENIEELKQASYYYKIGVIKLTNEDLLEPDFEKRQAEIGYELLTSEMKMSKKVADVTRDYSLKYNSVAFDLSSKDASGIPYAHIVGIVDYYDKLVTKASLSNDEALKRMLQIGGDKFNVFILHKFINMMRD